MTPIAVPTEGERLGEGPSNHYKIPHRKGGSVHCTLGLPLAPPPTWLHDLCVSGFDVTKTSSNWLVFHRLQPKLTKADEQKLNRTELCTSSSYI